MFLQIRSGSNGRQLKDFYAIFWLSGRFWRLVSLLLTTDGTLLQISWHVLFSYPKNIVVDEESIENNEFLVIDIPPTFPFTSLFFEEHYSFLIFGKTVSNPIKGQCTYSKILLPTRRQQTLIFVNCNLLGHDYIREEN